jgi:hypothetical protein
MCWVSTYVKCCGNLAHWLSSCLHVRTESYGNLRTPRPPVKKIARQNLGYEIFGHYNVGKLTRSWNTNIGAHEIIHPLTKNENFSVYKQGFMNFMLTTVVLSDSESCLEWVPSYIFYLLIYVSKLTNMCLMRAQIFRWSGRHVAPPTVLTRRVMVIYHRRHLWRRWRLSWPLKPKCCAGFCRRNSKSRNRCTRDLQWELIMTDHKWLPHIPSLSEWSPQPSPKPKNPLMQMHGLGPLRPNCLHLSYLVLRSTRLDL